MNSRNNKNIIINNNISINNNTITLVEKHIIKETSDNYQELLTLTHLSKNLYNQILYRLRQEYFNANKSKMTSMYDMFGILAKENQPDYRALPAKVARGTVKQVYNNMKSFLALLKKKKKDPNFNKPVRLPKYKDKYKGQVSLFYDKDALSLTRPGYVKLSGTSIIIKTRIEKDEIQFARIIPNGNHITIEIGYKQPCQPINKERNKTYAGLDLGVNNLAAILVGLKGGEPLLVNGAPVKSINQYYNKRISKLKSKLPEGQYSSKQIKCLYKRRTNKINDYFHKASSFIVNYLVSSGVNTLVIGEAREWKQNTRMGRENNQVFVQVPHARFVRMLEYKGLLAGIEVVRVNEAYTSKCSLLDNEPVCHHARGEYAGIRSYRGLYKSKSIGEKINADLNGAGNILKKYLQKVDCDNNVVNVAWNDRLWSDLVEGCSNPGLKKITILNDHIKGLLSINNNFQKAQNNI